MSGGYLLDTSIISILHPGRPEATAEFIEWLRERDAQTFICTISFFELAQGIARLARAGGKVRAAALQAWTEELEAGFSKKLLQFDADVARVAGSLSDHAYAIGRHPGVADIMIAAFATAHDLVLLTRNVRHFEPLGIDVVDPLVTLPR